MKPKLDRYDVLTGIVLVFTLGLTAYLFMSLPERMPTHIGLSGHVDGWSSKTYGAWLLPSLGLGVWLVLRPATAILPADWRQRAESSPMSIAALTYTAFIALVQLAFLYAAFHPEAAMGRALVVALALFTLVRAQLLPRMRRNPWFGVRTAFTLSSDENWLRTHRFAGYAMTVGGLAGLAIDFFSAPVSIGVIVAASLAPSVYSFLLARRLPA